MKVKQVNGVFNMSVYTDEGTFFGIVEEPILVGNKISGWRVRATKNSILSKILGGAKGVIVPHALVKAIDHIMIISKEAIPSAEEQEEEE